MKKTFILLYVLAGLAVIGAIYYIPSGDYALVGGGFVGAVVFAFFGYRSQQKQKAAIEEARIAAEKAREDEARIAEARARSRRIDFSVAGVTFKNEEYDGGKSRQSILKRKLKESEELPIVVSLGRFEYEGSPALAILLDDERIGSVPNSHLPQMLEIVNQNTITSMYADIEEFEDDDEKRVFRCDVSITYQV